MILYRNYVKKMFFNEIKTCYLNGHLKGVVNRRLRQIGHQSDAMNKKNKYR